MPDLIKQAEENVVKIAAAWEDAFEIINTFANFGNKMCKEHIGKQDFFEGLNKIKKAMYAEYVNAIHNCFVFVGIGGEAATEYSKQMFKETFREKDQFIIMNFLDKYGQIPKRWNSEEEDEFRKQAQNIIK